MGPQLSVFLLKPPIMVFINSTPTDTQTMVVDSHFSDLSRSIIIKLSRLRFGHNRFPPHLHRIGLSPSPHCPFHPSHLHKATPNHIFFECPHLSNIQQSLYSALLNTHIPTPFTALNILSRYNIQAFPHIAKFLAALPPIIII